MAFLPLHLISLLSVGSVGFFRIFKRQGDYTMARAGCKGKCAGGPDADIRASCRGAAVGQRGRSEADIRSSAGTAGGRAPDSAEADGCCGAGSPHSGPRLPRVRAAGGPVCNAGGGKRRGAAERRADGRTGGKNNRREARKTIRPYSGRRKKTHEKGPNGKDFSCAARCGGCRVLVFGRTGGVRQRCGTADNRAKIRRRTINGRGAA
jgi:hypothetical protein